MVIRAHARIFGGGQAPPTFRALAGSIIDQFDLIELQLDRRLASEHGDDDADLVLFDVDLVDRSDEGGQRAVIDPDAVAFTVRNHDLMLFKMNILKAMNGKIRV